MKHERIKVPGIYVSREIPLKGLERLRSVGTVEVSALDRQLSAGEIAESAASAEVLVSMLSDPLDEALLSRLPKLRLIAQYAVGHNNIDLDYCRKNHVAVTTTPGVLTDATADLTLALILAVTRRLVEGDRLMRAGGFCGWAPEFHLGESLQGMVLGIFGLGRIGQAVARRATAFGLKIVYSSRSRRPDLEKELGLRFAAFENMLQEADVVSIHVPLTFDTVHVFDRTALRLMKKGAYLINTARGAVIKEMDLVEVLEEGHLAGAGIDVYEAEPAIDHRLLKMDQVVLLPHIGSATTSVREKMALMVAESVAAYAKGERLPNRIA
ncbi:MAG: D-glycerate dehydrogenase [Pseudomonadota bacterium]